MKNTLLIGTSYGAVPLLFYLKQKNHRVSVCGRIENDPCHAYADRSFLIDYSQKEQLLELCENENFDYLVPSSNDISYKSASYVASVLNRYCGFDSNKISASLHTKNGFKRLFSQCGLPTPKATGNSECAQIDDMTFPLLVKPDDNSSGKGFIKVTSRSEIKPAVKAAQQFADNGKVLVEEFIEGSLHSHSAFVQNGKILVDFFVDEYCVKYPYQVDSSCLSILLSDNIKHKTRHNIATLISALNLADGLLHTQFITNGEAIWFIETMRRNPGDLYGTLIKKSTGFDYTNFYCNPFLSIKNPVNGFNIATDKYIARHTVSTSQKLALWSFAHNIPAKHTEIYPLKESGQILDAAPYDKLGILFSEFENKSQLAKHIPKIGNFITVNEVS